VSKSHLLITAATAAFLITSQSSGTIAQTLCEYTHSQTGPDTFTYKGYSSNPAEADAPGTSTVVVTTTTLSVVSGSCPDQSGTITLTDNNYIQGPGNSPFDDHDSTTCEATGTQVCP
jgi:hypothetical protein